MLAFKWILSQIVGVTLATGPAVQNVKPFPGVEMQIIRSGNAVTDVNSVIERLEALIFERGQAFYRHPRPATEPVDDGQLLWRLSIPHYNLAMYQQWDGGRVPVTWFEAIVIPLGILAWAREYKDVAFVPPAIISGLWRQRRGGGTKSWFAGSIGYEGFANDNLSSSDNVSFSIQNTLASKHRRSDNSSNALPTDPWMLPVGQEGVSATFLDFRPVYIFAKDAMEMALFCYAHLVLTFIENSLPDSSRPYGLSGLKCPQPNGFSIELSRVPSFAGYGPITYAEGSLVMRAAYQLFSAFVKAGQHWVPTTTVNIRRQGSQDVIATGYVGKRESE